MMDPINLSPADGPEVVHQNGVHYVPSNSGEEGAVSNDLDPSVAETVAPNGNFENFNQSDSTAIGNSSMAEIEGSNENVDGNNMTISKEEEVKITDQTEQSRARKGPVKNKNAKAHSSSGVHASLLKRSKNGKDKQASSAVSNGTSALESRPIQSIKSTSFNDRQSQLSKHTSKSDASSSEVAAEKKKPKSLKKGPLDKVQGEAESSLTNAEDAKPRRMGALPNYGFSFRCGERAERRREFYTKLEERIQAKEEEKSNLQAKSKETQEAELKKLRKSLTFKATPMPSFYQEPLPPKVELKKIPTTRAKSPKLGRKKGSVNSESDGNGSSSSRQGRLSLDEKVVSQSNNLTKGSTPVHQKKPQRKSLPTRLASKRTGSSNSPTSSKAIHDEKTSLSSATKKDTSISNATVEEKTKVTAAADEDNSTLLSGESRETSVDLPLNVVPSDKPSEEESRANGDIAVEENPQLAMAQEPVTIEH